MEFLDVKVFGNSLYSWSMAALLVALGVMLLYFLKSVLVMRLNRTDGQQNFQLARIFSGTINSTSALVILVVSTFLASTVLNLPAIADLYMRKAAVVAVILQFGLWSGHFITILIEHYFKLSGREAQQASGVTIIKFIVKFAVWVGIVLLILDNFDVNITALVTGLGVGGVAIGLATQSILSDLFASLSIILDKPFQKGEFIAVGEMSGTVERIGLKTTRMRSIDGEQLVFSNSDLLQSRIRNYEYVTERRNVLRLGVVYGTPVEKLQSIPDLLRGIIEANPRVRFDRVHFKSYGDYALNFEVVYFVLDKDYGVFMDVQQEINLAIYAAFAAEGIEFAYPTQTLFVQKNA